MKKTRIWLLINLFLTIVPLAMAQEDQIGSRGFRSESLYHSGALDTVSLFNGNLTITLPLGISYPVGGDLSYGFTAVYHSLGWEIGEREYIDGLGVERTATFPVVSRLWNAGMGWSVSPGRLFEPKSTPENPIAEDAWLYVDSSGAKHWFRPALHPGVTDGTSEYTTDSTYLRLRQVGSAREIDFPDGGVIRFEDEDPGAGQDWRVTERRDVHGHTVTVARVAMPGHEVWETYTDPHGRVQRLKFETDLGAGDRRLYEADLEAFGGARAVYGFTYEFVHLERCYRNTDPLIPNTSTVEVSVLTEIALPDGTTYEMLEGSSPAYSVSCGGGDDGLPGAIQSLRLRTLGELQWDYSSYHLPRLPAPPGPPPVDKEAFDAGASGVSERRELDAAGTVLGTWRYTNEAVLVTNAQETVLLDGETRTYVVSPAGDCVKHFFRADPGERARYGLPYSSLLGADGAGTFRSTETWDSFTDSPTGEAPFRANFFCSGTRLRSSRVLYEDDGGGFGSDVNRRLAKSRTVYEADGGRTADTTFSGFDGLGHYETETTGGSFAAGNVRTTVTDYELFVPHATVGGVELPLSTSSWVLGTLAGRSVTEGTSTNRETFCFDARGFLTRRRSYTDATAPVVEGPTDVVTEFERTGGGDLRFERSFGGDVQAVGTSSDLCALSLPGTHQSELLHTYQFGTRKLSRYRDETASPFLTLFDRTIDASTGRVATTTDPSGLTTAFTYDALGRLLTETPQEDAKVVFTYPNASPGTKARVEIERIENGGSTVLAREQVVFDDLGRVFEEKRQLPVAGVVFNTRRTLYDGRGLKKSVSEVGDVTKTTEFLESDPLGRPGRIRPPDGAAHDVILDYAGSGVSQVTRTVRIAAASEGGELPFDTIETYDRQGRLHSVAEPSGEGGALVTTTYTYDAGNRLTKVSTTDGTTTQERVFTYDGRGFLISEKHPEKGASGNGTVTYPVYDARGHALERVDGGNHLVFDYDRAGRLVRVEEAGGRGLKEFAYGTTGISTGKLVSATRHNHLAEFEADLQVREIYTYGADGRVSKRQTERTDVNIEGTTLFGPEIWFETDFAWTDLGDLQSLTYPVCTIQVGSECTPGNPSGQPARTVSHGYTNGFLTSVGGFASSITYHPNEMIASVVHPNGVTDLFELDPDAMRRPARIRTTGVTGGSNFDTGTYVYDGAGNVKAMGTDVFTYDGVSRLVQGTAQQGVFPEASVYDAFGNRVLADTFPVGARSIDVSTATNRLLGSPSRPVDYDDRGNQTQWGSAFYSYDAADRMSVHEDVPAGIDRSFVYTANDERIVVIDNSVPSETWSLRDLDGRVLREFFRLTGDTDWQKDTVHRQGQVLATDVVGTGVRHAHLDHLGTIRLWTGPGGSSPSHHTYTAFGEEIPDNFDGQELRFTGHERDVARSGGCTGTTTVDHQTLSTGQTITGCDELTSTNTTITSPQEVRFRAGDVIKLEEFSVATGAVFAAEIDGDLNSNLQDLDYMHARYCSPGMGRFLSADKAGGQPYQPQTWNRYSYVTNNPLKWVDPTGLLRVRANTLTLLGEVQFEVQFETNRAEIIGNAVLGGRFLPKRFRRLRRPIDIGRAFDEAFKGEFTETSDTLSEKLEFAPFEREMRDLFFDEVGTGVGGFTGRFTESQLMKLGEVVSQVTDRLVREGNITEEQRERILEKYDVERLAREAKSKEPGRDEDDERIPE